MKRTQFRSTLILAVAAGTLYGGSTARGADWLGGAGNWADGTKWSTGSAPTGFGGTAAIDNGNPASSVVTVSSGVFVPGLAVTVDAGDVLQVQSSAFEVSSIQVNGSLQTSGSTVQLGWEGLALAGAGTVTFGATSTNFMLSSAGGSPGGQMLSIGSGLTLSGPFGASVDPGRGFWVTNSGHVTVDGAGKAVDMEGSALSATPSQNFGSIEATNGASLALSLVQNAAGGTVSISGGGTLQWWTFAPGKDSNLGTINVNHSTLALHSLSLQGVLDGVINLNAATVTTDEGFVLKAGGVLSGTASIATPSSFYPSSLGGTVRPGGAGGTGTMSFTGSGSGQKVSFESGGHYECDLGAGGVADLLAVAGKLDLSASGDYLDLNSLAGAQVGVPYLVATYGTLAGAFDNVTPGYVVDYSQAGAIYVTAVPEPGGASGVVIGVGVLAGRRKRRGA